MISSELSHSQESRNLSQQSNGRHFSPHPAPSSHHHSHYQSKQTNRNESEPPQQQQQQKEKEPIRKSSSPPPLPHSDHEMNDYDNDIHMNDVDFVQSTEREVLQVLSRDSPRKTPNSGPKISPPQPTSKLTPIFQNHDMDIPLSNSPVSPFIPMVNLNNLSRSNYYFIFFRNLKKFN